MPEVKPHTAVRRYLDLEYEGILWQSGDKVVDRKRLRFASGLSPRDVVQEFLKSPDDFVPITKKILPASVLVTETISEESKDGEEIQIVERRTEKLSDVPTLSDFATVSTVQPPSVRRYLDLDVRGTLWEGCEGNTEKRIDLSQGDSPGEVVRAYLAESDDFVSQTKHLGPASEMVTQSVTPRHPERNASITVVETRRRWLVDMPEMQEFIWDETETPSP